MALLKYISRDTSVLKQSLSLTQKEKEVVSDFVSQQKRKLTVYTAKTQYLIPLTKNQWFSHATAQYNSRQYYPPYGI